jgi:hypothetical protein
MTIVVEIEDLVKVKASLEESLLIINKYISQHSAKEIAVPALDLFPPRTKTRDEPKRVSLGPCMFVQRKNLTGVTTREALETSESRCNKNAFVVRSGVILCSRHKDSDIQKIEEILSTLENVESDDQEELEEGCYDEPPIPPQTTDIEEVLAEIGKLEKLLEENRFIPCRIEYKSVCIITHKETMYVIDPCGDCFGKITDAEVIENIELGSKKKEYIDVKSHIEPLRGMDRGFLKEYRLTYVKSSSM